MYLIPSDYSFQIRKEIKTILSGGNDKKLGLAENAAVGEMKSYLKKRYDIDQIFYSISGEYTAGTYQTGALVYWRPDGSTDDEDYAVYLATVNTSDSPDNEQEWELFARNPFIILKLVDITLYHLHSKDATRLMPKVREDRYQDAIDWLKMVGRGELEADLPQRSEDDEGYTSEIRFNSHPPENQRY